MSAIVWKLFWIVDLTLAVGFSLYVFSTRKRVAAATVAWILTFFAIPYGGVTFYLLTGIRRFRLRHRDKPKPSKKLAEIESKATAPSPVEPSVEKAAKLGEALTSFPKVRGNKLCVHEESEITYEAMLAAIGAATHHVHMEFYIFKPDETGERFKELLIRKARQGVECRLLVDHIGSFGLRAKFVRPMVSAGVKFQFFGKVRFTRPWGFQLRNHRKLLVVDGQVAFVGSQNIGNEYTGLLQRIHAWRDTAAEIRGPSVRQWQTIFTEDWEYTTGEKLEGDSYFPTIPTVGTCSVQALPTGPDEEDSGMEKILLTMIHSAVERFTVITPYFVPSRALIISLGAASGRGVKVDFLVPAATDAWIVDRAARSWYRDLLLEGARVRVYEKRFLHAKVVTVDRSIALIGSHNMDERSFRLNFECSALIFDSGIVDGLLTSFDEKWADAREITLEEQENQPIWKNVRDGVFRVLSPLL